MTVTWSGLHFKSFNMSKIGGIRYGVGICTNQYNKEEEELSFFTFPKDSKLQNEWIRRCYRKDKINPKTARICSAHFREEDSVVNFTSMKEASNCNSISSSENR